MHGNIETDFLPGNMRGEEVVRVFASNDSP